MRFPNRAGWVRRFAPSRYIRYRLTGKKLYTSQPCHGQFRVTFGHSKFLRGSWAVRKHLGRLACCIRKEAP